MDKELVALLKKARKDPVFWCKEIAGINTLWHKQEEILYSIRDNKFTTVRSCHGSGKSFITARAVAWFLTTHPYSIVVTTAPTGRQVREILWQEIAKTHSQSRIPLGGKPLTTTWQIAGGWYAIGFSSDQPDRFQGFHAKDMLVVVDEACGVDNLIFEGVDSLITGENNKLLLIGNPTNPEGRFFDSFKSPLYHKIHIDALETPNLVAGRIVNPHLVTPAWVEDRRVEWGEDSPAWISRVRGEFPETSSDAFIPLDIIDYALENEIYKPSELEKAGPCIISVDPARFGDDESVICVRRGNKVTRMMPFYGLDNVQLAREVLRFIAEEHPQAIIIDTVGQGSGVFDVLFREYGVENVMGFISNEKANDSTHYLNKRVEAWAHIKSQMRQKKLDLTLFDNPRDREIIRGQFSGPKYKFDNAGRYQLEKKEDMKKRGLKSPDRADAIALAFYFDGPAGSAFVEYERPKEPKPGTLDWVMQQAERQQEEYADYDWLKMGVGE